MPLGLLGILAPLHHKTVTRCFTPLKQLGELIWNISGIFHERDYVIILWKAFFHSLLNDNIFNSLFFITHLFSFPWKASLWSCGEGCMNKLARELTDLTPKFACLICIKWHCISGYISNTVSTSFLLFQHDKYFKNSTTTAKRERYFAINQFKWVGWSGERVIGLRCHSRVSFRPPHLHCHVVGVRHFSNLIIGSFLNFYDHTRIFMQA